MKSCQYSLNARIHWIQGILGEKYMRTLDSQIVVSDIDGVILGS